MQIVQFSDRLSGLRTCGIEEVKKLTFKLNLRYEMRCNIRKLLNMSILHTLRQKREREKRENHNKVAASLGRLAGR